MADLLEKHELIVAAQPGQNENQQQQPLGASRQALLEP